MVVLDDVVAVTRGDGCSSNPFGRLWLDHPEAEGGAEI